MHRTHQELLDIPITVKISKGYQYAGKPGLYFGCIMHDQMWAMVLFHGDEDPTMFKLAGLEEILEIDFEVGSKVIIVNNGKTYSTYKEKFVELGFKNVTKEKDPELDGTLDSIFTVTAFTRHGSDSRWILVAIKDDNANEYLIEKDGLRAI